MKNSTKTMYVNKFFRAFPEEFTVKEFIRYMSYVDCKITKKEAEDIQMKENNPLNEIEKVQTNVFFRDIGACLLLTRR